MTGRNGLVSLDRTFARHLDHETLAAFLRAQRCGTSIPGQTIELTPSDTLTRAACKVLSSAADDTPFPVQ